MLFLRRLTETDLTPGTAPTAFSTLAEQAAQLMPVTVNFSRAKILPSSGDPRTRPLVPEITWPDLNNPRHYRLFRRTSQKKLGQFRTP
jgi:hypothetical protein